MKELTSTEKLAHKFLEEDARKFTSSEEAKFAFMEVYGSSKYFERYLHRATAFLHEIGLSNSDLVAAFAQGMAKPVDDDSELPAFVDDLKEGVKPKWGSEFTNEEWDKEHAIMYPNTYDRPLYIVAREFSMQCDFARVNEIMDVLRRCANELEKHL